MATIPLQTVDAGASTYLWETLTATDVGEVIELNGLAGIAGAVQFIGTFGGTVTAQVSVDGSTWATLADTQGTAIAVTAAALHEFASGARYMQVTAGVGVADVDVYLRLPR